MPSETLEAAVLFCGGVLLLVLGLCVTGVGAWWFAAAVRAAHTARAHGAQADATETIVDESRSAIESLPSRTQLLPDYDGPPDDQELRELIRASRNGRAAQPQYEEEYTTTGNEGIPDQPPIPGGSMYRGLGEL